MTGEISDRRPGIEKRQAGNFDNYREHEDGSFSCKDCGGIIMAAVVIHPVHMREMPGAGFGEVVREEVPYCPNCETEPSPTGDPVHY